LKSLDANVSLMPTPLLEQRRHSASMLQTPADSAVHDVVNVLIPEVLERAQHGLGASCQSAQAGSLMVSHRLTSRSRSSMVPVPDRSAQQVNIWLCRAAGMHFPQDSVMQNSTKKRPVDHAGCVVHDDHAAEPMMEPSRTTRRN